MIIDAKDLIIGRLGTVAAKKALLGEDVIIVNTDKAIISGTKEKVYAAYKQKRDRGTFKGPFIPRRSDLFVKRLLRGMIPKRGRGPDAFARIKCYVGTPSQFEGKAITIKEANVSKIPNLKYVTIQEICRQLGGKI
ncbi:MAG: 50S ribosomal protein L13 [Candidatus Woesearchaeota archaeon]